MATRQRAGAVLLVSVMGKTSERKPNHLNSSGAIRKPGDNRVSDHLFGWEHSVTYPMPYISLAVQSQRAVGRWPRVPLGG